MNTLTQEKANVARLRDLYENETDPLVKESIRFSLAEARLWHDVAEYKALSPEKIEQARKKKCRTGAIVCFIIASIAAVILAVALFGCATIKGMGNDGAWLLQTAADNISTEK